MSISDKDLPIKFIFVSVYLVRIIYIFDDVIIGVVVINEVFLGRYWFRLLILWWRWAKGQKIPEQLNMISIIMFRNLYWLSPSKVGYYSKNSVQKFSVQQGLEIHGLEECGPWRYTVLNWIPKHLRYTVFGQKPWRCTVFDYLGLKTLEIHCFGPKALKMHGF